MTENPQARRLSDWDAERLRSIAERYETPTYVLDLDRVRANGARLRAAFPDANIAYAVKANTTRAVLETLEATGVDAECAAAGEVKRALDAGFAGDRIRYTAVNPPDRDLDYVAEVVAAHDLVVTVGAEDTLDRLVERGFDGRLCVRVNPGVGAGHHAKVSTGAEPKFGVPYERVPAVAERARDAGDLVGVHAHVGSGVADEDLSAHRELVARMGEVARTVGDLEFVAVGGGFGVPYHEDEPPLDLRAVATATREALGDVSRAGRDGDAPPLAIEPGRYFVADAGVLLTTVNTVKPTPDATVVGIDAGMTTLARPALYGAYHAVRSLAPDADDREAVQVDLAGPVCETGDVLGRDRSLPDPRREDLLAVGNAGAYGYEMASNYNSRPRPAVVAVGGDEADPGPQNGDDRDADVDHDVDDGRHPGDDGLVVRRENLTDLTALERW